MFKSYVEKDRFGIVHIIKEIKDCPDFLKEINEMEFCESLVWKTLPYESFSNYYSI
jgi:hypothetical protein